VTPRAIITDIEGTTSSLSFVHDVLFPYSYARLADHVRDHAETLGELLDSVRAEAGNAALDVEGCVALLRDWHREDRKIGPLKTLQGMIWAEGFAAGELQGHVYPDAIAGLRRWHAWGIPLYIYSSGSVAAQKLLFGHTSSGDLTPLFAGHFDTAVGGKKEASSYRAIAGAIDLPPADLLFLSDVEAELAAAIEAGLSVMLLVRDGPLPDSPFPTATSFDTILAESLPA
jgi:enolase-phosphatase E1